RTSEIATAARTRAAEESAALVNVAIAVSGGDAGHVDRDGRRVDERAISRRPDHLPALPVGGGVARLDLHLRTDTLDVAAPGVCALAGRARLLTDVRPRKARIRSAAHGLDRVVVALEEVDGLGAGGVVVGAERSVLRLP